MYTKNRRRSQQFGKRSASQCSSPSARPPGGIGGAGAPPAGRAEPKVDLLPEIVAFFRVGFVAGGQAIERAAKFADGGLVQLVPLRRRPAALIATHNINSRRAGNFITPPAAMD